MQENRAQALPRVPVLPYLATALLIAALTIGLTARVLWLKGEDQQQRALLQTQAATRQLGQEISNQISKVDLALQAVIFYYRDQQAKGSFSAASLNALLVHQHDELRIAGDEAHVRADQPCGAHPVIGDRRVREDRVSARPASLPGMGAPRRARS